MLANKVGWDKSHITSISIKIGANSVGFSMVSDMIIIFSFVFLAKLFSA